MFTGIIASEGKLQKIEPVGGDFRMTIQVGKLSLEDVQVGDSIACNGVCLTAIALTQDAYIADVSSETLKVTTLGSLQVGSPVNLEKALRLQDRLGGHLVSGHVDGVGEVVAIAQEARSWRYQIKAPQAISRYIAAKGSICINGISLTVNAVQGEVFDINIVPHTRQETTIRTFELGTPVNLEVDLLARYIERLLLNKNDPQAENHSVTRELLMEHGFLGH